MVEEMIAMGHYKEALDLLDDRDNEQVRYQRLVCLFGLEEYSQGLQEAKVAKLLATETYYDVLGYYISFLKENELFEEAVNVLVEELSMPYVPYEYETILNQLYDEILFLKQEANADYEKRQRILSNEELQLYLEKGLSEESMMMALDQLSGMNIRHFLPGIRQVLRNPNRLSIEKSLLLEILKEQEVDEILEIYKHEHTIEVNPLYLENVMESLVYENVGSLLESTLEQENPSLFTMCIDFLELYLYDWYPMLEVIEDEEALAAAIHFYLAGLNGIEEDQEDLCYRYGSLPEAFERMLKSVENFRTI